MNIILIFFAIKYKGDWDRIYKALEDKEKVELSQIKKLEDELKEGKHGDYITILDKNYPKKLKEAYKPPFVLFYKGDRKLIDFTNYIVVMSEDDSDKSKGIIKDHISEIAKKHGFVTASHQFKGDKLIQDAYPDAKRMIVSPKGIDAPEWKDLNKNTVVVSEYPSGAEMSEDTLNNSNRLTAAFGTSLVLVSSTKDGAVDSIATQLLNLGKEIYAFPGDGSETDGNSQIIKEGANLITGIKDIYS